MGRVSGRWPAGDGAPRPPGRKSDHPQDQRQDLPHPSGQNRGQSGLREEAVRFFPISAPTGGQSVTPHLAPPRPPNWYPFSPPPTDETKIFPEQIVITAAAPRSTPCRPTGGQRPTGGSPVPCR